MKLKLSNIVIVSLKKFVILGKKLLSSWAQRTTREANGLRSRKTLTRVNDDEPGKALPRCGVRL
jgi:hypothetical protein